MVDRAGDSGLCRVWVGAVVKLRPRVFQHDETTCVLRFQQGKGGKWEIRCPAAHNAVGLAGESPAVGIDCLST